MSLQTHLTRLPGYVCGVNWVAGRRRCDCPVFPPGEAPPVDDDEAAAAGLQAQMWDGQGIAQPFFDDDAPPPPPPPPPPPQFFFPGGVAPNGFLVIPIPLNIPPMPLVPRFEGHHRPFG